MQIVSGQVKHGEKIRGEESAVSPGIHQAAKAFLAEQPTGRVNSGELHENSRLEGWTEHQTVRLTMRKSQGMRRSQPIHLPLHQWTRRADEDQCRVPGFVLIEVSRAVCHGDHATASLVQGYPASSMADCGRSHLPGDYGIGDLLCRWSSFGRSPKGRGPSARKLGWGSLHCFTIVGGGRGPQINGTGVVRHPVPPKAVPRDALRRAQTPGGRGWTEGSLRRVGCRTCPPTQSPLLPVGVPAPWRGWAT
jgi:hypothetical protein